MSIIYRVTAIYKAVICRFDCMLPNYFTPCGASGLSLTVYVKVKDNVLGPHLGST